MVLTAAELEAHYYLLESCTTTRLACEHNTHGLVVGLVAGFAVLLVGALILVARLISTPN